MSFIVAVMIVLFWGLGVCLAWFQINEWRGVFRETTPEEYAEMMLLSIFSWLIYPIHWIKKTINRLKKD